jgi:hypothetical protein
MQGVDTTTDKKIEPKLHLMPDCKTVDLEEGFEYRIKEIKDHIKIIVVSMDKFNPPQPQGLCEVFGRELPVGEPVFFHMGEKIAIYCWQKVQL